jgi:hypothetical protein
MSTEDSKTFSLSLSPSMMLGLILTALPVIGGGGYAGVTFYNKMTETIAAVDDYKPYDDTALREKVQAFEIELKAVKERQLSIAEQAVRIAEKSSDAIALARETKAIASGAAAEGAAMSRETKSAAESASRETKSSLESMNRELQSRLAALKQDLDSTTAALRSEMNALKRATTNPMSNR